MDFLLLGSNYFEKALRGLGHHVVRLDNEKNPDPPLPDVLKALDFQPDAVVLTDDLGRRTAPAGLSEVACPTIWYGVDSPINHFWQRHWAVLFDLVLMDQRAFTTEISRRTPAPVHWLPVAVDTGAYKGRPEKKRYDLAFVGVINETVRPKRSRIIERLSRRYRVKTAGGRRGEWVSPSEAAVLYRGARIVLNENLFSGVTTRMFEAMASGSLLLTEAGDGVSNLFDVGREMDVYGPDDLMDKVDGHLGRPERRETIARRGQAAVLDRHDISHRARTLADLAAGAVPGGGETDQGRRWREEGKALFLIGVRWPRHDGRTRLLRAERLLFRADRAGAADTECRYYLGLIARMKGSRQGALARLNAAAEDGSVRAALTLGYVALENGSPKIARDWFRAASTTAGESFPAGFTPGGELTAGQHLAIGRALAARGHTATPGFTRFDRDPGLWTALEHFQAAVRRDPVNTLALEALGGVLESIGAHTEAHAFYSRAAELNPDDPAAAARAARSAHRGYIVDEENRKVA